MSPKAIGNIVEQFIGLELQRMMRFNASMARLYYWRDHAGPEADYVIEQDKKYTPIEVKWTENPSQHDIRHLLTFRKQYDIATYSYLICRCERPILMEDGILALPWQQLETVFN